MVRDDARASGGANTTAVLGRAAIMDWPDMIDLLGSGTSIKLVTADGCTVIGGDRWGYCVWWLVMLHVAVPEWSTWQSVSGPQR